MRADPRQAHVGAIGFDAVCRVCREYLVDLIESLVEVYVNEDVDTHRNDRRDLSFTYADASAPVSMAEPTSVICSFKDSHM